MARPVKKEPYQWKNEIMDAALRLFMQKGFAETSVSDIMQAAGGAKGLFYRFYESKEELMKALGDKLFFENNPFDAVMGRADLNGLQKIRALLYINQSDTQRGALNVQAIPILEDPHILAAAVDANRRILTPLWYALLEEGRRDGSIQTEYTKELSELLPLMNFWLIPSVFPATAAEIRHKFQFITELLAKMGLPLIDSGLEPLAEKFLEDISPGE